MPLETSWDGSAREARGCFSSPLSDLRFQHSSPSAGTLERRKQFLQYLILPCFWNIAIMIFVSFKCDYSSSKAFPVYA